jgi:HSP20 family protein
MARDLQSWSPFRELERFRRDFNDVFDRTMGGAFSAAWPAAVAAPKIESYIEDDKMIVRADLPGIVPKDVDVTVTGNTLTLRGRREARQENKGRDFIHREVTYGNFERSLTLPDGIKAEDIRASYQSGVLELSIPIPTGKGIRKVPIQVEGEARQVEERK